MSIESRSELRRRARHPERVALKYGIPEHHFNTLRDTIIPIALQSFLRQNPEQEFSPTIVPKIADGVFAYFRELHPENPNVFPFVLPFISLAAEEYLAMEPTENMSPSQLVTLQRRDALKESPEFSDTQDIVAKLTLFLTPHEKPKKPKYISRHTTHPEEFE
ncbi:hypothetical protein BH11PAT1_BH11PAT1_1190 [soil metagenome]